MVRMSSYHGRFALRPAGLAAAAAGVFGLAGAGLASASAPPASSEPAPPASSEPTGAYSGPPATFADGECTIGMTQINQTAIFFTQMNEGAQEAADEVGCELTIVNANNDAARQSSDIESFVSEGVDAIIVVAIDVNGVLPAVSAARDAGIKVVAIDAQLEEGSVETFVGVDNEKAGAEAGQWVVDAGLAQDATYGIVDARNSFIQNQREDAFRSVVDAAGATFTQAVSGDNVQEQAADAAQNLVTAQPDLDFVYTTGEPATVGAVAALDPGGDTKIIGWDLTAEVIGGIDSGLVLAVIQQNPREEGVQAIYELSSILAGGEPKGFIDVPITVVTADNVDDFRAIFE
jgi:ribose transport system substrate-binding protein